MNNLTFEENNTPRSTAFDDIYYNVDGGLEEKKYVFIQANKLPIKFAELSNDINVLELGFGTGLSFLLTALEYNKHNANYNLNFTSTELYPLSYTELDSALAVWEDLYKESFVQKFLEEYKKVDLSKNIEIKIDNINLTILIGDARETLKTLKTKQHCFYLDGFAPSKNPVMWGEEVFAEISRLAEVNSSATTYACSRQVKDILNFAGFEFYKQKGFGKKREMIIGIKK